MNIVRNISVLILLFGIIIMTVYITKSYTYNIEDSIVYKAKLENKKREMENKINEHNSKRPSKIFGNMFEEPSVWMGYSDQDTITKNIDGYAEFNTKKYSNFN